MRQAESCVAAMLPARPGSPGADYDSRTEVSDGTNSAQLSNCPARTGNTRKCLLWPTGIRIVPAGYPSAPAAGRPVGACEPVCPSGRRCLHLFLP
jgi:hypothetical protein